MEKRIIGIGGIFIQSKDPKALSAWYLKYLHLDMTAWNGYIFPVKDINTKEDDSQVFSFFKEGSEYMKPSTSSFMLNLRTENLESLVKSLEMDGIHILDKQSSEYGQFAWILDADGNKVELFQAP